MLTCGEVIGVGADATVFAGELDMRTETDKRTETSVEDYGRCALSICCGIPSTTRSHARVALKTPHRFITDGIGHLDVDQISTECRMMSQVSISAVRASMSFAGVLLTRPRVSSS